MKKLSFSGYRTTPILDGVPSISLVDVEQAWISGAASPRGPKALLILKGEKSNKILVSGCDAREAAKLVEVTGGAVPTAVQADFNFHNADD